MTYVREYPPPSPGRQPTKKKMIWTGALTSIILGPISLSISQFQVRPFSPGNCGAFTHWINLYFWATEPGFLKQDPFSREGTTIMEQTRSRDGALANFARPRDQAFANPAATPTLLVNLVPRAFPSFFEGKALGTRLAFGMHVSSYRNITSHGGF